MKVVVDTNIVFSAILGNTGTIGDLLLNSGGVFEFCTCELLRVELTAHQERMQRIAGYSAATLAAVQRQILRPLTFIEEGTIPFAYWQQALPIVRDVDMDDIAFVALADFLSARLWTGDRRLLNGIRVKGYPNAVSTDELLALRQQRERQ